MHFLFHFSHFLRCIWMFPMLETQKLYFQWSLSQQANTAFHSKTKQILAPVRWLLHSNQHLFTYPTFLLLLPLDQLRIDTRVYTLSQLIQRKHHLPIQTSFQTQIHRHQGSTHLYYPSVLHHTPWWILHLLVTTIRQSVRAPQDTGKVQHIQSLILLNRLHSPPSLPVQYKMPLNQIVMVEKS